MANNASIDNSTTSSFRSFWTIWECGNHTKVPPHEKGEIEFPSAHDPFIFLRQRIYYNGLTSVCAAGNE